MVDFTLMPKQKLIRDVVGKYSSYTCRDIRGAVLLQKVDDCSFLVEDGTKFPNEAKLKLFLIPPKLSGYHHILNSYNFELQIRILLKFRLFYTNLEWFTQNWSKLIKFGVIYLI